MIVDIHISGYDSAAEALFGGNRLAAGDHEQLTGRLAGFGGMAGDDRSSAGFVAGYDDAAREAVGALADLVSTLGTLGVLTARSAANHRDAERASVYGGASPYDDTVPPDGPLEVCAWSPPSALGGDGGEAPMFWEQVVDHLQGWAWPSADSGRLRDAARTWREAAGRVEHLDRSCRAALSDLARQRSPEVPVAEDTTREVQRLVRDLAGQLRAIGDSCEQFAEQVEETRDVVRGLLADLAWEAGLTAIGAGVVSVFTLGGGAAAGAGVVSLRATAYAHRIIAALRSLQAVRAVGVVARAGPEIRGVRAALARFTKARPARTGMTRSVEARAAMVRSTVDDPRVFDPTSLTGLPPRLVGSLVRHWKQEAAREGLGVRFADPVTRGRQIRLMPGYPKGARPGAIHEGPYAVISQNGVKTKVPLEGNPLA